MCPGRSLFVHAQRTLPHRRATAGPARRAHMPSARAPRRPVACCPSPNRCPAVVAGCGPLAVLHPVALCLARAPPRRCVGLWSGARLSAAGPFLRSRAGRGNFLQSPAEARAGAGPALRALRCSLRSAARATPLRPRALLRAFAGPRPPAPVARRCRARKSGGRRRARSGAASCSPQSHKFTSARPPRFALAALPFPCRSAPAGVFPRAPPGRAGAARRLRRRARRRLRPCIKIGGGGGVGQFAPALARAARGFAFGSPASGRAQGRALAPHSVGCKCPASAARRRPSGLLVRHVPSLFPSPASRVFALARSRSVRPASASPGRLRRRAVAPRPLPALRLRLVRVPCPGRVVPRRARGGGSRLAPALGPRPALRLRLARPVVLAPVARPLLARPWRRRLLRSRPRRRGVPRRFGRRPRSRVPLLRLPAVRLRPPRLVCLVRPLARPVAPRRRGGCRPLFRRLRLALVAGLSPPARASRAARGLFSAKRRVTIKTSRQSPEK